MTLVDEYRAARDRSVATAKATLKVGDRVSRGICGGRKGTFTFTHWVGIAACGAFVDDCHPNSIYAVNGSPMSFFEFDGDLDEVMKQIRSERLARRQNRVEVF
jgi:hypothetical protein